jgi:DNA-binding beta-propeller fold protein YncE
MEENRMDFMFVPMDFTIRKMPDVSGVAVDSNDTIYYTTRAETPVIVISPVGKYLNGFGTGLTKNAHGICIDNKDCIYVVDGMRNCVFKFDTNGNLLLTIGTPDSPIDTGVINYDYRTMRQSTNSFNHPAKIAALDKGDLFIADGYGNARVHHYSNEGKFIKSWGEPGNGPGQFNIVHGIGVDNENGDVYVCDRENFRIQIFTYDGKLKTIWNDIWRPTDVCIRGDNVYVAELGELMFIDNVLYSPKPGLHHSQVRVFNRAGKQLAQIGTADSGEHGSFFSAHGVTVNHTGELLVSEVAHPLLDVWIAYPEGKGMSSKFHPCLQKFRLRYS